MSKISTVENGLHVVLEAVEGRTAQLLHLSPLPWQEDAAGDENARKAFRLVEISLTGDAHGGHRSMRQHGGAPGDRLKVTAFRDLKNTDGRKFEIVQLDEKTGLEATSHLQFYTGVPVVRSWTTLVNTGKDPVGIEAVSSFSLTGLLKEGIRSWAEKGMLTLVHNQWMGEMQCRTMPLSQAGLTGVGGCIKRVGAVNTGNWSGMGQLPMGFLQNTEAGATSFWQIESNGSWSFEIAENGPDVYLMLGGPNEQDNHWWKNLRPGASFTTVPAAFGAVTGGVEPAVQALTDYRRRIRRPHVDNRTLPVIFNDYMNCLNGDPTTEKLKPLIDAAAEVGCDYFVIDCGWYSEEGWWWTDVGDWQPSKRRFPGGIREPLDYIRSKGMIPGLWLEIEVMGVNYRKAAELPDDWFFCRHGKRIISNGRFQLDFRNPEVRKFADEVIDRVVGEYGAGYIKMDYNINAGIGTDLAADSAGDGLLGHNLAYLDWLDAVLARHPSLVMENCGSGGLRMDYAMLSRLSIQSTSDQTDYRTYAPIAASSPLGVTPEQAAVWSYPLKEGDREEVVFNMVNSLLLRIHQSGHLAEISPERKAVVTEGIRYYRSYREMLATGRPFWPLGIPGFQPGWTALGMELQDRVLVAVWRLSGAKDTADLSIPSLRGTHPAVKVGFPTESDAKFSWNPAAGTLGVKLPRTFTARIFELRK